MAEIFLITSAFLHALWNSCIKKSSAPIVISFAILTCAAVMNVLLAVVFEGRLYTSAAAACWTVAAGICEGFYFSLLAAAYSRTGFGLAYALMRGSAMCLVWLISTLAFHEPFSLLHFADIILILSGILLATNSGTTTLSREAIHFSLLNGALIAGYHISYGKALQLGSLPAGTFGSAMLFVALPLFLLVRGKTPVTALPALFRKERKIVSLGGLSCGISFFLFLIGLQSRHAGIAISLRNTSVAFGALLAYGMGEQHTARQWLGISLIGVGAILLPLL